MRADYQFLIGREFCVGEEVYTIEGVVWEDDQPLIEAQLLNAPEGVSTNPRFSLGEVVQQLLVEEEIELFNPSYLAVAGS